MSTGPKILAINVDDTRYAAVAILCGFRFERFTVFQLVGLAQNKLKDLEDLSKDLVTPSDGIKDIAVSWKKGFVTVEITQTNKDIPPEQVLPNEPWDQNQDRH